MHDLRSKPPKKLDTLLLTAFLKTVASDKKLPIFSAMYFKRGCGSQYNWALMACIGFARTGGFRHQIYYNGWHLGDIGADQEPREFSTMEKGVHYFCRMVVTQYDFAEDVRSRDNPKLGEQAAALYDQLLAWLERDTYDDPAPEPDSPSRTPPGGRGSEDVPRPPDNNSGGSGFPQWLVSLATVLSALWGIISKFLPIPPIASQIIKVILDLIKKAGRNTKAFIKRKTRH